MTGAVSGGCGLPVCAVRIEIRRLLPDDDGVAPPCERCTAALREDLARSVRSAGCHVAGPW